MDALLYHIGRLLGAWQDLKQKLIKGRRGKRRLLLAATVAYCLAIVVLIAAAHWLTDVYAPVSVLVFLPPLGWLLPLLVLVPAAMLLNRWLLIADAGCVLAVLLVFMGWHGGSAREPATVGGSQITVATNNIGSNLGTYPYSFFEKQNADIIVLQEFRRLDERLENGFSGYHLEREGEFLVLSRYPLADFAIVPGLEYEGNPVAARCVVEHPRRSFVLYDVHLPTRAPVFHALMGRGLFMASVHRQLSDDLAARNALLAGLLDRASREELPVLFAGDFNLPARGYGYRLLADRYTDAFAAAGNGYGYTVPGVSNNWVGLCGPWLRIDYVWAGPSWEVLAAVTEPGRASQHRAVSARLWLRDAPSGAAP